MNNSSNGIQHNKVMNIFLNNIFDTNILKGYGGTFLILLSALGNFQIMFTVIGGIIGIGISVMSLIKSIREARKAKLEEQQAELNLNNIKNLLNHGKSSSSEKEETDEA